MSIRTDMPMVFTCCVLAVLLMLSGCEEKTPQSQALPGVRFAEVAPERVKLTTELPGRVSALMVSEVRPQVSGIILNRYFEEGKDVQAGQVLYQIDPALFEAAHNSAKANLAKAEANETSARLLAERYGKLIKGNTD